MPQPDYIRRLSDDLEVTETIGRILQEVGTARCWEDVDDVLHQHRHFYLALSPRVRERLNAAVKDLMAEILK
jgi:hypothetical protein